MGITAATARPRRRNKTRSLPNAAQLMASANPSRALLPSGFPMVTPLAASGQMDKWFDERKLYSGDERSQSTNELRCPIPFSR